MSHEDSSLHLQASDPHSDSPQDSSPVISPQHKSNRAKRPAEGGEPRSKPTGKHAPKQRKQRPPAAPQAAETADVADVEDAAAEDEASTEGAALARLRGSSRGLLRNFGACFFSMVFHLAALILLALFGFSPEMRAEAKTIIAEMFEQRDEELLKIELEEQLEAATEMTMAVVSAAPAVGIEGGALGAVGTPTLDQRMVEDAMTSAEFNIETPTLVIPTSSKLIQAVPDGALGDPRAIVDDYQQAMDRITQEIMWHLDKGPVLVVWCFDQSNSMKDDQREVRDRIDKVYSELGIGEVDSGGALVTAVTSYGDGFNVHTKQPTSIRADIRDAIDAVPVDETGVEKMCQAVAASIDGYREFAKRSRRQMMLVLVTDESGDRQNNDQFLEQAIGVAKEARCKIYTLGREAVFGYPYVHIRHIHHQTKRPHWIPIDRGPETGFVEQLQTDGFHRRYDAFPSGFGPYEQTRMARETGGIFFMLPSLESALVRGEKRRYELEAMRAYNPDIRSRQEVFEDRDKYPLRTLLWKVITDLNPYNKQLSRIVELRIHYIIPQQDPVEFKRQVAENQQKAVMLLNYLAEAEKALADGKRLRDDEPSPRWQANYDLIYAQTIAYQARIYEYGVYLQAVIDGKEKLEYPMTRQRKSMDSSQMITERIVHYDIGTRKKILVAEKSQPYIDRSTELLKAIITDHPGTPWAARAQWELNRGFGVHLVPDYDPPYIDVKNPDPLPKL